MLPITCENETSSAFGRIVDYVVVRLPIAGKGSLAILDQALISGSNFLLGILLARWLVPTQYGAYAMAYSIFLLLSLIYQALLLEPQSVVGPSKYADSPRTYLNALLWLHGGLALMTVIMLSIWAWVGYEAGWSSTVLSAFAGVTIAAPFILLFWLVRGACYTRLAPERALEGAFLYCLIFMFMLLLVYRKGQISPFTAFLLMAVGALLTSIFMLIRFGRSTSVPEQKLALSIVGKQHWTFGRWELLSSIVVWIPWNIYYSILGRHSGLAEAGDLRALFNLFMPLGQTLNALALVLLPYAARKYGLHGRVGALGRALKIMVLFVCAGFVYWGIVIPFQRPIFRLLYNGHFTNVAYLLPWLGLASIFSFATLSTAISLRAMQTPSSVFVVYSVASATCLLVGVPSAAAFGLRGVIWGLNISSMSGLVTGILLVRAKAAAQQLIERVSV